MPWRSKKIKKCDFVCTDAFYAQFRDLHTFDVASKALTNRVQFGFCGVGELVFLVWRVGAVVPAEMHKL